MFRFFKAVFVIVVVVIVGNWFFGFLDELIRVLDKVPVWVWPVLVFVLLAVFSDDKDSKDEMSEKEKREWEKSGFKIYRINEGKRKERRKKKRDEKFKRIGDFIFRVLRFIIIFSIVASVIVYGVKYIGVDWFEGVFDDSIKFYEESTWYELVGGSMLIILLVLGMIDGAKDESDKGESDKDDSKEFKKEVVLSKEEQVQLNEIRRTFKNYQINANTVFLKHPKLNVVIPEKKENLKDNYVGFTLVSEELFKDWLGGSSLEYLENNSGSDKYVTDEETLEIMKEAYRNDIEITEKTIFLESNFGQEITPFEIYELTTDMEYLRITTRKKFEKWINS